MLCRKVNTNKANLVAIRVNPICLQHVFTGWMMGGIQGRYNVHLIHIDDDGTWRRYNLEEKD